MINPGKTKAEMFADAANAKAKVFDDHVQALVDRWMEEIRAINTEREPSPPIQP
jgi:hypothetical protein